MPACFPSSRRSGLEALSWLSSLVLAPAAARAQGYMVDLPATPARGDLLD